MLGPVKPRHLDQAIAVSLADLILQDHFNRHLETRLDLGFVRDWAQELYAERGRPSIDPVVFFKLQLSGPSGKFMRAEGGGRRRSAGRGDGVGAGPRRTDDDGRSNSRLPPPPPGKPPARSRTGAP